jgi:hypothetical protein
MPVRQLDVCMEMTDSEQLSPAARIAAVSLTPTPPRSWVIKPLHDGVAAAAQWRSLTWSAEQWRRRLTNPRVRYATILVGKQTAGLVEFESQPDAHVEITMFGLLPPYSEASVAAYAFTLATKVAWELPDSAGRLPRRVWVRPPAHEAPDLQLDYAARGYTPAATPAPNPAAFRR